MEVKLLLRLIYTFKGKDRKTMCSGANRSPLSLVLGRANKYAALGLRYRYDARVRVPSHFDKQVYS
jgi:hypothetical protein